MSATDPHAGVRVHADYRGPLREDCEVLVVGSGPGGAVVAKELAEAGRDVVLVEEGPPFGAKALRTEASQAMARMLREGGMRVMRGPSYTPTIQANALGGGSLVNSAICCRAPGWALEHWAQDHGLGGLGAGSLDAHYAAVESFLGIAETPTEVLGERNRIFARGCQALGISAEPTPRNAPGCRGSGECFTGCRNGAKRSTDVSYVPAAIRAGARVYTSVRAERLRAEGRRVTSVLGRVVEPFTGIAGHAVELRARQVVLAAGCMATPLLLLRSGLGNRSGQVGLHLQAHPGLSLMGVFPERVDPWAGATQGYHSLQFLEEGIKLEVLWAPPALLAVRFPGMGHDFKQHLTTFARMAPLDVFVSGQHSRGRVRPRMGSLLPNLSYRVDGRDMAPLQRGLVLLAEICWAAGAEAVLPGARGVPDVLRSPSEMRHLREARLRPQDVTIGSNHVFGTTRMGADPRSSVVDATGRCHDLENLWVADTGVFPASPAVNPMLTCMALARRIAGFVAQAA